MVLVILAIGLIMLVSGILLCHKSYDYDELGFGLGVFGAIISVVCAVAICVLSTQALKLPMLQDKIDMYTEENTKIENQIDAAVKAYMEHENEVFTNTTSESSITLVSLYPELKSDTLVQKQLEIYNANNEIIKGLKEKQIDGRVIKWWLYFGS